MRFTLTLLLLFMVLPGLWAQDAPIEKAPGTGIAFRGLGIQLMPFSMVTRYPRLRLGIQYKMERFSLVLDVEYGNDGIRNVILQPDKNDDYQFVGIRPEIRYSLPKLVRELYIGMELPYTRTSQQFSGGYYSEQFGPVSVSSARQQRNRFSIVPKIGAQFLEGRFTIDAYMGAGIALVEWTYLDREDLRSVPIGFFNESFAFFNEDKNEGSRSVLELSGGLRFGFWLSR